MNKQILTEVSFFSNDHLADRLIYKFNVRETTQKENSMFEGIIFTATRVKTC